MKVVNGHLKGQGRQRKGGKTKIEYYKRGSAWHNSALHSKKKNESRLVNRSKRLKKAGD